jgi:hypothetical protein
MPERERVPPSTVSVGNIIWTIAGAAKVEKIEVISGGSKYMFVLHDGSHVTYNVADRVPLPGKFDRLDNLI